MSPPDVLARIDEYSSGSRRPPAKFLKMVGLDVLNYKQKDPSWCMTGTDPEEDHP